MPRPKGKKRSVRLSVSLDEADHAELQRIAIENDLSVAWVIRKAVTEFIGRSGECEQGELPLARRSPGTGRSAA